MTQAFSDNEGIVRQGRIGNVPVWIVAGVGIAGIVILFMWIRNRRAGDAPSISDTYPGTVDDASLFYEDGALGSFGLSPSDPAYPVGMPAQGTPAPQTNIQWARLAGDYLIGKGNDPTLVVAALSKYIGKMKLTPAEKSIVNLALTAFGVPPEGPLLPTYTVPTPRPTTPPTPTPTPSPIPTPTPSPGYPRPPVIHHVVTTRTSADVQWNAGTNAVKYKVYMSGGGAVVRQVGTTSALHFNITGLKPGTRYWFSARSVNSAGQGGSLSNIVTTVTKR